MTALILGLLVSAAAPNDVGVALRRPLSPGAVALLLEHRADPRVAERIAAALLHEDAPTRAAAARVAHVAALGPLVPRLRDALSSEVDVEAAREQAMALLALDAQPDDSVLGAARRLGRRAAAPLALAVARAPGALSHLTAWRQAGVSGQVLSDFLVLAARKEPGRLALVGVSALRDGDGELWGALLAAAGRLESPVAPGLLASALGRDDQLRAAALEAMALSAARGEPPPAVLQAAIDDSRATLRDPRLAFALEIMDRLAGRTPRDQTVFLRESRPEDLGFLVRVISDPRLLGLLASSERAALWDRLGLDRDRSEARARQPPVPSKPGQVKESLGLSLADGFPRQYVEDTLAITGCASAEGRVLGGRFRRDPLGRPIGVSLFGDLAASPACLAAAFVVVSSHLVVPPNEAGHEGEEVVLLPVVGDVLACIAGREAGGATDEQGVMPPQLGGHVHEPRKTHSVNPRYPESAKANGVQGLAILEATITAKGCIGALRLTQSSGSLPLDAQALIAVAQWRYTPTLLGGVPVPVLMTVNVNFKLR
jgi:TonB family protein